MKGGEIVSPHLSGHAWHKRGRQEGKNKFQLRMLGDQLDQCQRMCWSKSKTQTANTQDVLGNLEKQAEFGYAVIRN